MQIIVDLSTEPDEAKSPLELLEEATENLLRLRLERREYRAETRRLSNLYYKGLLPITLSNVARTNMRRTYFAAGGQISACPPATAEGAMISPYWGVDKRTLVKGIREIEPDIVDTVYPTLVEEDDE